MHCAASVLMLAICPTSASLLPLTYRLGRLAQRQQQQPARVSRVAMSDGDELVPTIEALTEPTSELEIQQRHVIRILAERLNLTDAFGDEREMMSAIPAAGDGRASISLQNRNEALQDDLRTWNKQLTWAVEQVRLRDTLIERVAAAKKEVAAAEAQVEPLRAECKVLEQKQSSERARRTQLEGAKMACERTLVTLPADIAKLRKSTSDIEAMLIDLQAAVAPLVEEQSALTAQQERLEAELADVEADVAARRHAVEEMTARVAELTATTAETREDLVTRQEVLSELVTEEGALEAAYAPLTAELQMVRDEVGEIAKRLAKLQKRNDTLGAELQENVAVLTSERSALDMVCASGGEHKCFPSCAAQQRLRSLGQCRNPRFSFPHPATLTPPCELWPNCRFGLPSRRRASS